MFLVSSCSHLCSIHWRRALSWEWRFSWSSANRRCSNYIWVFNNFIAYFGAPYIRDLKVCHFLPHQTGDSASMHTLWSDPEIAGKQMPWGNFFVECQCIQTLWMVLNEQEYWAWLGTKCCQWYQRIRKTNFISLEYNKILKLISIFQVSIMFADKPVPLGIRTAAGTVIIKFMYFLFTRITLFSINNSIRNDNLVFQRQQMSKEILHEKNTWQLYMWKQIHE